MEFGLGSTTKEKKLKAKAQPEGPTNVKNELYPRDDKLEQGGLQGLEPETHPVGI